MTVGELKKELSKYPSDLEVFTEKTDIIGNVGSVFSVRQSVYLYFGKELPCAVLTDKIGDYKNV